MMQPKLTFQCTEKWEHMRVGLFGRHCLVCDKEVVDFTGRSKVDLVRYLLEHEGRSVCGRVRPDQLDVHHDLHEVYIQRSLKIERTSNLAYYLLAISGLAATSCQTQDRPAPLASSCETPPASVEADPQEQAKIDSPSTSAEVNALAVAGQLMVDDRSLGYEAPDPLPEVMPEFPGGQDSLYAFIRRHLAYPQWESEHGIAGRVYVQFVVGTDGRVTAPRILRGVEGARTMDQEVLRVIGLMPAWTPGRNGEKVVATRLALPISFVL